MPEGIEMQGVEAFDIVAGDSTNRWQQNQQTEDKQCRRQPDALRHQGVGRGLDGMVSFVVSHFPIPVGMKVQAMVLMAVFDRGRHNRVVQVVVIREQGQ